MSVRRAVFFDIENSNRIEHVALILAHLGLPAGGGDTVLWAIGNWRVVSYEAARLLSDAGATLVHSAPAFGVKDWSDLRIAVAAGLWLGSARPGDRMDVVSDDRAFDAIGDLAVRHGVAFRRLSARMLARGAPVPAVPRRGRRRRGRRLAAAATVAHG